MTIHSAVIQKLLSTNAQLGRRMAAGHHLKPYLYGVRNKSPIIDSDKTLISLRNALDFISHLSRSSPNSRFLFVNTNPLFDDIFDHMTRKIGYGSFTAKSNQYWKLGGFLTNSASPKKFRSRNKKLCFGPVHPPDCVVIVDTERKSSVVNEAARLGIPIVGLVDSAVPRELFDKITYPIVCNDSVQFVYLVCNLITKTFLLEQRNSGRAGGAGAGGGGGSGDVELLSVEVKSDECEKLDEKEELDEKEPDEKEESDESDSDESGVPSPV